MMRSTTLGRVLFFVCVLFLLLCCTVNVKAQGSSSRHLAEQVKVTIKEEENVNGEEIKRIAENVKAVGQKIEEFYITFDNNISGVLKTISDLNQRIIEAEKKFLAASGEDGKTDIPELSDVETNLTQLKKEVGELKQLIDNALQNENKEIKTEISRLVETIGGLETLKVEGKTNIGSEDSNSLHEAKHVNELAIKVKSLAEKILDKINQHDNNVLNFAKKLSETKDEVDKTIESVDSKELKKEQITKALQELQTQLASFIEEVKKIQEEMKKINGEATQLKTSCEELERKTSELVKQLEKKAKDINESKEKNLLSEQSKENEISAAPFSTETEKKSSKENDSNLQEQNDLQTEEQQQLEKKEENNKEEESATDKDKQTDENGTVSSSNSSGVVVTHFIVFLFYCTLYGIFLIENCV